jgi:hypothetical protein
MTSAVIDHDIQVQLHAAGMNGLREGMHVRVGAEMRIDVRKIGDPVAVIAGGLVARRALHRFILEDWGEPYRGRAKPLNVVQARNEALQIAAVIEAFGSRIESCDQPSALETAAVIGRIAILEPVGQEEINDFVGRRAFAIIRRRLRTGSCRKAQSQKRRCERSGRHNPPAGAAGVTANRHDSKFVFGA